MHRSPMTQAGFTMIELVLVILVLGIMSAVVAPRFFNFTEYEDHAAYNEVAGAVRYAQKLAVASGCEVQVDLSGGGYALQQHSTDCTTGVFATISDHPVTFGSFSGVSLSSAPISFIFDAMGRSSSGATVSVGSTSFTVVAESGYVDAQ